MALPDTMPTSVENLVTLLTAMPESEWPTARDRLLKQLDDRGFAEQIYDHASEEARVIPQRRKLRSELEMALTAAAKNLAAAERAVTGLRDVDVFDLWYSDYAEQSARDLLHVLTDTHRMVRIADTMRRDIEGAEQW